MSTEPVESLPQMNHSSFTFRHTIKRPKRSFSSSTHPTSKRTCSKKLTRKSTEDDTTKDKTLYIFNTIDPSTLPILLTPHQHIIYIDKKVHNQELLQTIIQQLGGLVKSTLDKSVHYMIIESASEGSGDKHKKLIHQALQKNIQCISPFWLAKMCKDGKFYRPSLYPYDYNPASKNTLGGDGSGVGEDYEGPLSGQQQEEQEQDNPFGLEEIDYDALEQTAPIGNQMRLDGFLNKQSPLAKTNEQEEQVVSEPDMDFVEEKEDIHSVRMETATPEACFELNSTQEEMNHEYYYNNTASPSTGVSTSVSGESSGVMSSSRRETSEEEEQRKLRSMQRAKEAKRMVESLLKKKKPTSASASANTSTTVTTREAHNKNLKKNKTKLPLSSIIGAERLKVWYGEQQYNTK